MTIHKRTEQSNKTMAELSLGRNNHNTSCAAINNTNNVNDDDLHPLSFTILWSPLPPITWLIPFIGHMGIANSKGIANDFQGPYTVGDRGRMVRQYTIPIFLPHILYLHIHTLFIKNGCIPCTHVSLMAISSTSLDY